MASWFSSTLESIDASAALNKISELSSKVDTSGALNKIAEISSKVKESLPVDDELIGKLTLNSSEMMAERTEMEAQERRKETARNSLTKLLPWETKDEERDILIEECREAILALSTKQETFTLPISPPEGLVLFQTEENDAHEEDSEKEDSDEEDAEKEDSDEEDAEKEDSEDAEQIKAEAAARLEQTKVEEAARLEQMKVEAAARLEKIKPLPPILDEFDLDAHVGLIERLFKVDKELVKIHSLLTGAGEKEKTFWKNYFINCAYTRYEKGLEIEEIWCDKAEAKALETYQSTSTPLPPTDIPNAPSNTIYSGSFDDGVSVELTFERDNSMDNSVSGNSVTGRSLTETSAEQDTGSNEYEIVEGLDDELDDDDLDDLEAEIARELGEI